jgi:hypothetical protein
MRAGAFGTAAAGSRSTKATPSSPLGPARAGAARSSCCCCEPTSYAGPASGPAVPSHVASGAGSGSGSGSGCAPSGHPFVDVGVPLVLGRGAGRRCGRAGLSRGAPAAGEPLLPMNFIRKLSARCVTAGEFWRGGGAARSGDGVAPREAAASSRARLACLFAITSIRRWAPHEPTTIDGGVAYLIGVQRRHKATGAVTSGEKIRPLSCGPHADTSASARRIKVTFPLLLSASAARKALPLVFAGARASVPILLDPCI